VWVIGVDRDMYEDGIYSAPNGSEESVVLTSAVKKVGSAAYTGLDGYFNGEFSGGEVTTLGYKEDGVGLPSENPNLDEVLIEEATKSLEQNSENIPSTLEECEKIITTATISGELQ
jgi:basic membrane protein A